MRNLLAKANRKTKHFVKANPEILVLLVVFCVCASWFAVTNPLNTAPDEAYHYGAIKSYAQQYSPFVRSQVDVSTTNDMVRYPSYLYHYLTSFIYRGVQPLGLSNFQILVVLRLCNVLLGAVTMLILYNLLRRLVKKPVALSVVAVYGLLPITLVLYGGLNYDNLLLAITFCSLHLLLRIYKQPRVTTVIALLTMLELGALTQYSFLPILVAIGIALGYACLRFRTQLTVSIRRRQLGSLLISIVLFCTVSGLFLERYGVNLVRYHSVVPACEDVHPLKKCLGYAINQRNYDAAHSGIKGQATIAGYVRAYWLRYMLQGLAYPKDSRFTKLYLVGVCILCAWSVGYMRRLRFKQKYAAHMLLGLSVWYVVVLLANGFAIYRSLGQPLAINGRYLLPILPFPLALGFMNIQLLWGRLDTKLQIRAQLFSKTPRLGFLGANSDSVLDMQNRTEQE